MKNYGLIGCSGYIAPRHMQAIKETDGNLIAALDKYDSVGIIDSFFPNADFFVEFERFDRHLEKLKNDKNIELDYISICTPNYLHDSHIRMALRRNTDAICEKPLVLNPWNLDSLINVEKESGNRIWNVLQLRIHESIIKLKNMVDESPKSKIFDIDLTYIASRGSWYYTSWKGDLSKSGGVATNIGIHFFDVLSWIFGDIKTNIVHVNTHDRSSGYIEFDQARVRWFLSINYDVLPDNIKKKGMRTYRSLRIEGEEYEFSDGFKDLHTKVYNNILNGNGFGLEDARKSIEIVHDIRNYEPIGLKGDFHPFAAKKITKHPFGNHYK